MSSGGDRVVAGAVAPSTLDRILDERVLAIVRADTARWLTDVVSTLVEAGVRVIEFTLTTPGALEVLKRVRSQVGGDVVLGVGTVLAARDAEASVEAGAAFLVTPVVAKDVIDVGRRNEVPVIPGSFTATELETCWQAGASAVKLFPASVGGPAYVRAVRAPLPHIPLVPTGGIQIADVPSYLQAGAVAVGIGSPLLGDAVTGGSLAGLAERSVELVRVVRDVARSTRNESGERRRA